MTILISKVGQEGHLKWGTPIHIPALGGCCKILFR